MNHELIEPLSKTLVEFGFINLSYYAIFITLAITVGMFYIIREGKKLGFEEKMIQDLIFYSIIFGFIGARIYYVVFSSTYYLNNLLQVFAIWNGGLAIHGAIIGGAATIFFYSNKNKLNFFKLTDMVVIPLIFGQIIGRWGNFVNQEAYGKIIHADLDIARSFLSDSLRLPDFIVNQMYIGDAYYHPTFLYESVWNLIGLIVLLVLVKLKPNYGVMSSVYLIWYGVGRFFIEALRTDSLYMGTLKIAQVFSIISIIIAIGILVYTLVINKGDKYGK